MTKLAAVVCGEPERTPRGSAHSVGGIMPFLLERC